MRVATLVLLATLSVAPQIAWAAGPAGTSAPMQAEPSLEGLKDADAVTIPLTVRKVWVEGVRHRVRGSIAFANVTQDWMKPMRTVWDGILGSQEVNICGEQPKR